MAIYNYPVMPCTVIDLNCGIRSNYNLVLTYNKNRFNVVLSRRLPLGFNKEYSIKCQLLQKLNCAIKSYKNSKIDIMYKEISDLVISTY